MFEKVVSSLLHNLHSRVSALEARVAKLEEEAGTKSEQHPTFTEAKRTEQNSAALNGSAQREFDHSDPWEDPDNNILLFP